MMSRMCTATMKWVNKWRIAYQSADKMSALF